MLTVDFKLGFEIPQKVSKINVEQLPVLADHDVVTVPVAYVQHVHGHTVASSGESELHNGQGLSKVLELEPAEQVILVESGHGYHVALV